MKNLKTGHPRVSQAQFVVRNVMPFHADTRGCPRFHCYSCLPFSPPHNRRTSPATPITASGCSSGTGATSATATSAKAEPPARDCADQTSVGRFHRVCPQPSAQRHAALSRESHVRSELADVWSTSSRSPSRKRSKIFRCSINNRLNSARTRSRPNSRSPHTACRCAHVGHGVGVAFANRAWFPTAACRSANRTRGSACRWCPR